MFSGHGLAVLSARPGKQGYKGEKDDYAFASQDKFEKIHTIVPLKFRLIIVMGYSPYKKERRSWVFKQVIMTGGLKGPLKVWPFTTVNGQI